MSSDSRTEKFEISFPTQKSTDILIVLTPQSIYAIPFQIFRIYSHEFRFPNLKTWVRFSGLKFCGRDLKKFQVKSDEKFKVLKLCKIVPKCPNVFWGDFSEKCFLPSVQWSHPKISKKSKKIKLAKRPQIVSKIVQNCFEHVLRQVFSKKNCPVLHGGSGLPKISKKSEKFQNSKSAQNRSQKCPNVFWTCLGQYFRNFFAQGSPRGISDCLDLELWVPILEIKKHEFRFPNLKIWEKFSGIKFWGSDLEKIQKKIKKFQSSKNVKNVPKCQNVSWGDFFEKVFLLSVPWSHRKFAKKSKKNSKLQKSPKSFPKSSKLAFNMFCGYFSEKKCPVFHGGSGLRKFWNKIKKISKFQKCPKSFPKVSKRVLIMLWGNFSDFFLPSAPCRVFQIFRI